MSFFSSRRVVTVALLACSFPRVVFCQSASAPSSASSTRPPASAPPAGGAAAPARSGITDPQAELPRVRINTAMPKAPAAGHRIIPVPSGGDLQFAIDIAQPGDVIELAKGAVFVGNYVLKDKGAGVRWIVIRPSNSPLLPKEGERMTPAVARKLALPKVIAPNDRAVFATDAGAHHYRLVGLELGMGPEVQQNYGIVQLGNSEAKTLAEVPHDITLDRLYIHGSEIQTLRRCVALNSAMSSVIDSWISDCHEKGADSQAILGWTGPGPYKIVNNYLEAAGENLMFGGGGDPPITGLVPSDIEVRRNHITKPASWKGRWTVKNLFELKNAQRVLVEGNILEGVWQDGQSGGAIALKSTNQYGRCVWCVTQDVTFRLNWLRNIGGFINIAAHPEQFPVVPARRFVVTDNVVTNINVPTYEGEGRAFTLLNGVADVLLAHNTVLSPTNSALLISDKGEVFPGLVIRDNIIGGGQYGFVGQGAPLLSYLPRAAFRRNVIVLAGGSVGYPDDNFYPISTGILRMPDLASGDVTLPDNSPLKARGTDGLDVGANVAAVKAAIQGVRAQP